MKPENIHDLLPFLFFYSVNLAFILTNLYGFLLKQFYKAKPYRNNYNDLFPSQGAVSALYLVQICELPYLFMIGQPAALFYVNSFSALLFASLLVVMCDNYFFLRHRPLPSILIYFSPVLLVSGFLLLGAVGLIYISPSTYRLLYWVVCLLFSGYVLLLIRVQRQIRRKIKRINESNYSNTDDFPLRFAKRIEWVPLGCCLVVISCFMADNVYAKALRDAIFTVVNVWFLMYTLDPHRTGVKEPGASPTSDELNEADEPGDSSKHRLSVTRCTEIQEQIEVVMKEQRLFVDTHLTIDALSKQLNTNKNYISEAIGRSSYGSFYTLINRHRVEYAIELMQQNPQAKIEVIAFMSGFSSGSIFSQIFKRIKGCTPTQFNRRQNSNT